jgi:predicted amidohydrolase YtcJ
MVLNGFDAVRKAGFKNTRLTSGHTTLVDPKDKPRFKELDVIVNTFATDIAVDHPGWREAIGEERYKRLQPMKSFVNDGVKVVLSADWPTAQLNPFLQIYTAMTRSRLGEEIIMPPASEKLSLEDAIKAYTSDAAYALRMENIVGSIEVGKRADLIVLDRDIFKIPTDEIANTNVAITIMNGKIVHEEALNWLGDSELSNIINDFDVCGEHNEGNCNGEH